MWVIWTSLRALNVQQPSNCLEVPKFYSICCLNECESVLRTVERAPMAQQKVLIDVVQRMVDAQDFEPQNLTTQMVSTLHSGFT